MNIPDVSATDLEPLRGRFPNVEPSQLEVMSLCLDYDPDRRATCTELMGCSYFDGFEESFAPELDKALRLDGNEFAMKRKRRKERKKNGPDRSLIDRTDRNDSGKNEKEMLKRQEDRREGGGGGGRGRSIERGDGREGPLRVGDDGDDRG